MRKVLAILLVLGMLLTFAGCFDGSSNDDSYNNSYNDSYPTTVATTTATTLWDDEPNDGGYTPQEPEKTPVEKVADYVMTYGRLSGDTYYYMKSMPTSSSAQSSTASISWNPSESVMQFAFVVDMNDGGSSSSLIEYSTSETQRVVMAMEFSASAKFYTHGKFNKSTFTKNSTVTLVKNDNVYDETPAQTITTATRLALNYAEDILDEANIGVTLDDLGFVSW